MKEPLFQASLLVSPGESCDHGGGRGEENRVAALDRFAPECDSEMTFTDARRSEEQQAIAVTHPASSGELADLLRVDRRLCLEVKCLERALRWELRDREAHLDTPFILASDFCGAKELQRLAQAQLSSPRLIEQRIEPIADRRELEATEHAVKINGIDTHHAPPTIASYSFKGRNKALCTGSSAISAC